MPAPVPDHDQRLKVLLKEFFEQFFRCFFPAWAARFDFGDITWLDKEVFLAPALDGEPYATGENLLGVALSALMRVPPERRAELHAEGLQRIARSGENDFRRYLLAECLEAYADLDEAQRQRLQALLTTAQYQEVRPLMITTYERGKIEGKIEGKMEGKIEGRRETALLQLE